MTRKTFRRLIPVVGALVLAFGLVSSASASSQPPARLAEPLTLEASPNASIAWSVLEGLLAADVIPEPARIAIARAAGEQLELRSPGFACRRILENPDAPAHLVERCRAALDSGEPTPRPTPGEVCRRVAANPGEAPDQLVERCRDWIGGDETGRIGADEACRRVANAAESAGDDELASLIERCREWLQSQDDDSPTLFAVCRRIADAEAVDGTLVERCRDALGDDLERERPTRERPDRRPDIERREPATRATEAAANRPARR